jgi:mannose-1-phosphate guanylyltransferase
LGEGIRLVDKLVFGRYCVDKTGAAIDLQAAALDWLITDARNNPSAHELDEHKVIKDFLKEDN